MKLLFPGFSTVLSRSQFRNTLIFYIYFRIFVNLP